MILLFVFYIYKVKKREKAIKKMAQDLEPICKRLALSKKIYFK